MICCALGSEPIGTYLLRVSYMCAPESIEIDISRFSAKDLQSLKEDDPFLYYSIPAVQRAELF
eukprot:scaffold4031_cov141-Skeletonema_menzelii.AAC.2